MSTTRSPDLPLIWLDTEDSEGEVFWVSAAALQGRDYGIISVIRAAPHPRAKSAFDLSPCGER